jgi:hypothetical protein
MSGELIELATVAALVGAVPDVSVLSVRVDHSDVKVPDERRAYTRIVSVDVHAASVLDAHALMDRWGLYGDPVKTWETEPEQYQPGRVWRQWAGWIASASDDLPVSVQVTAAEDIIEAAPSDDVSAPRGVPVGAVA